MRLGDPPVADVEGFVGGRGRESTGVLRGCREGGWGLDRVALLLRGSGWG